MALQDKPPAIMTVWGFCGFFVTFAGPSYQSVLHSQLLVLPNKWFTDQTHAITPCNLSNHTFALVPMCTVPVVTERFSKWLQPAPKAFIASGI